MQILSEIREQPALLAGILTREQPAVHRLARSLRQRRPPFAMIVARGTSDNAAVYGKYVLESLARLPVALAAPSLYTLYNAPPDLSSSCVLALSQSGQSPDLVAVLTEARRQGALTAAVVNQQESPLAEAAEHVLWCGAGLERTVAATKSYTAELLLLAMLAIALAEDANLAAQLPAVPKAVASVLHLEDQIASLATAWRSIDRCVVLGRGYAFATALECSARAMSSSRPALSSASWRKPASAMAYAMSREPR